MKNFRAIKQKTLARERIEQLFKIAEEEFGNYPERSNRYVEMARRIATKFNIRMPSQLKRRFCKHCLSYLRPGVNCRVRTKNKKVVIFCANCKGITRIPFLKEKKLMRKKAV